MRRGEIRRVRSWDYVGHEATGNRPCRLCTFSIVESKVVNLNQKSIA